jgi:hypothetical protein
MESPIYSSASSNSQAPVQPQIPTQPDVPFSSSRPEVVPTSNQPLPDQPPVRSTPQFVPSPAGQTFDPRQQEQMSVEPENYADPNQPYVPDQQGWWQTPLQPQPEYLMAEWQTDSRVSTQRSKQYYSSLAVIVLLVSLILFFAGQTLLIFVVLAFLFISYVLNSIRAESVIHQITSYGIRYRGERLFYWEQLGRFWIRNNRGVLEVHVEAPSHFGNELILLAPPASADPEDLTIQDIVDILSRYLIYEEPIPSQLDRWVLWLQEKFPLE